MTSKASSLNNGMRVNLRLALSIRFAISALEKRKDFTPLALSPLAASIIFSGDLVIAS